MLAHRCDTGGGFEGRAACNHHPLPSRKRSPSRIPGSWFDAPHRYVAPRAKGPPVSFLHFLPGAPCVFIRTRCNLPIGLLSIRVPPRAAIAVHVVRGSLHVAGGGDGVAGGRDGGSRAKEDFLFLRLAFLSSSVLVIHVDKRASRSTIIGWLWLAVWPRGNERHAHLMAGYCNPLFRKPDPVLLM